MMWCGPADPLIGCDESPYGVSAVHRNQIPRLPTRFLDSLLVDADRETLTALRATRVEDLATSRGLHASTKTVRPKAAGAMRLISTLHGVDSIAGEKGPESGPGIQARG